MSRPDRPAPLHADTLDLGAWLAARLAGPVHPVDGRMFALAMQLHEETALALERAGDRLDWVDRMDLTLTRLRAVARLAEHSRLLDAAAYMALAERLDGIGRQIGGWKRRLRE